MKRALKTFTLILLLSAAAICASGQDIIVITPGNFIRGTIQATNYSSVVVKQDDESIIQYMAKDIKEFVWNGETYVSKPIVIKKRMEFRFFKIIEQGAVNLYAIGGSTGVDEQAQPKKARIRPSIGIGGGTGGFSGAGIGGGISFGGGRNRQDQQATRSAGPTAYFIEKVGTGPMQEIPVDAGNSDSKNQHIKDVLLQKLNNDTDLTERIKATDTFDAKLIKAFVTAYNEMHKQPGL